MLPIIVLAGYWPLLLAFSVFGLLHSLGAREPFKLWLARTTSPFFVKQFWRLTYFVLSYIFYYQVLGPAGWDLHPENNDPLIVYPDQVWTVITAVHLGSIAVLYAAFLQSDYLEFIGLRQAWRGILELHGYPNSPSRQDLFGTNRLEVRGIYAWVRHPMLAGGLLYLLTIEPTLNTLIFIAMYATYMFIGSHYEELRLIRIFGDDYKTYQKQVGAFVPYIHLRSEP